MARAARELRIIGLQTLPEVRQGDDLASLILEAAQREETGILSGDVVVVTQKVLSKAEGRIVDLAEVAPSPFALEIATRMEKDPRLVEVVFRESRRVVRMDQRLLVMETHHGYVCANAGVDHSNIPGDDMVSLLPLDPDGSAERIRRAFQERTGAETAVIISDTFGRPWREGTTEVAIGVAGMAPVESYIGLTDTAGHLLRTTAIAVADELASAAGLVMEKVSRVPVAIVRGFPFTPGAAGARSMVRPAERDLFR
ncbi:MAG: coenzyme F420-0:L-glutamate ligase [Chloroflexi bacterium]|nr:coenzyme F420-0:L-glutamate ligase [Chloroflexota bacterium]